MENQKNNTVFIASALFLLILINLVSMFVDWVFDIRGVREFSIYSFLTYPIIWGIFIFVSLKFFKKLPLFMRQPVLRVILLLPLVILDITDDRTGYAETPSYLIYLYNEGLLPIFGLLLEPLNHMENFQFRLFYSNLVVWIGFALLQAFILYFAEKIMEIENKNQWLTKLHIGVLKCKNHCKNAVR